MRVGYLARVWLASPYIRELRDLVRYRQQLVNERRNIKLRIRALLRNHRTRAPQRLTAWTRGWLAWLGCLAELGEQSRWVMDRHMEDLAHCDARIEQADQRLEEATVDDAVVSKLCELPGVGVVTAWVLRAEIGRFNLIATGKQLSRYFGLSPRNASSGERQADAGLIKAGSNLLRATLIQGSRRPSAWSRKCATRPARAESLPSWISGSAGCPQ
jgi:transposase